MLSATEEAQDAVDALTRLHKRLLAIELPDADHFVMQALANLVVALDGLERLDRQLGKYAD